MIFVLHLNLSFKRLQTVVETAAIVKLVVIVTAVVVEVVFKTVAAVILVVPIYTQHGVSVSVLFLRIRYFPAINSGYFHSQVLSQSKLSDK